MSLEVEQNDVELIVRDESGSELRYDKENNTVTLDSSVNYSKFIKMVKLLKRTKNRASFDLSNIIEED